jgi:hypothetical protein
MKSLLKSPKHLPPACALAAAALAASVTLWHGDAARRASTPSAAQSVQDSHPLDALDREVQKRFHNIIGFGMARIGTEKKFAPETAEEKSAARELEREGYRVGLYLAGRAILDDVPEQDRRSKVVFGSSPAGQGFSGPIFLSSSDAKGVPTAASLWDETRRALRSFESGSERYGFKSGEWDVEARPVRASAESCLKCHKARVEYKVVTSETGEKSAKSEALEERLKVGDPLGVLVYAYRKKR